MLDGRLLCSLRTSGGLTERERAKLIGEYPSMCFFVCLATGPGDYFGELALLNNDRRRATVKATKPTVCLTLGRETFKRLLGPLETLLKEREEIYEKYTAERSHK